MMRWALAALVLGLVGCSGDSGRKPAEGTNRRDDYQRLRGELDKLDNKLADWSARAKAATGPAKADMEKAVDQLEQKRDEAARRLEELKDENKGNWEELKSGATRAFNDFRQALDRVHLRFHTK